MKMWSIYNIVYQHGPGSFGDKSISAYSNIHAARQFAIILCKRYKSMLPCRLTVKGPDGTVIYTVNGINWPEYEVVVTEVGNSKLSADQHI